MIFKENAETINDWSKKAANSFGMSEFSAKKYTGTMGEMFKSMGMADDKVLTISTDMVGLAGDPTGYKVMAYVPASEVLQVNAGLDAE